MEFGRGLGEGGQQGTRGLGERGYQGTRGLDERRAQMNKEMGWEGIFGRR